MFNNIFSGVLFPHWTKEQDRTMLIIAIVIIVLMIVFFIVLKLNSKSIRAENQRIAKRIAWYKEQMKLEENNALDNNFGIAQENDNDESDLIERAELDAILAGQAILLKEEELRRLFEINEMTKKELAAYQRREGTYVSEDIIINIITEHEVNDCNFAMDSRYSDCSIPKAVTCDFDKQEIIRHVGKKDGIEIIEGKGKNPTRFKVKEKTFALVSFDDDKIKMSFKCGPDYGAKLSNLLDKIVSKARFPYGLIWFSVSDSEAACSLELIKLLLDISYRITKLGY